MFSVQYFSVTDASEGQRLDNYLIKELKGVPWSHIYKKIRKGEVRVNKKRAKVHQRLVVGDKVRVPPISTNPVERLMSAENANLKWAGLEQTILLETDDFLVIDKPANLPVHSGSGTKYGVIERLRALRPDTYLELGHRLDKGTSGCLFIAKKRAALLSFQEAIQQRFVKKTYVALSEGCWPPEQVSVNLGLKKLTSASGDTKVVVSREGKASRTDFKVLQKGQTYTLVQAQPFTGRMHQIRAHMAHYGCPIVGDDKYGHCLEKQRLFLHAASLHFTAGVYDRLRVEAPTPGSFQALMTQMDSQ